MALLETTHGTGHGDVQNPEYPVTSGICVVCACLPSFSSPTLRLLRLTEKIKNKTVQISSIFFV